MSFTRFIIPLIYILSAVSSLRITTQPTEVYLNDGDNLSLSCRIEPDDAENFSPLRHVITWKKKQTFDIGGSEVTRSGDYGSQLFLQGVFRNHESGRFQNPIFDPIDPPYNPVTSTIQIFGVEPEDAGIYECQLEGGDGVMGTVAHEVFIKERMESLSIFGYPDVSNPPDEILPKNGATLEYARNSEGFFSCVVEGGRPEPRFDIDIDGVSKTAFFSLDKNCTRIGDTELLQYERCAMRRFSTSYRPDSSYSGKMLTCSAVIETEGDVYHEDRGSVTLEIVGPPEFTDCEMQQEARPGNDRGRIRCAFTSAPPATSATWTLDAEANLGIRNGGQMEEYSSTDIMELEDGSYEIILEIRDVTREHLREYELEITNDQGSETRRLTLVEGGASDNNDKGKKEDSGSSRMGGIIAAAVLVPLVVIVLAVVLIIFLIKKRKAQASSSGSAENGQQKKPYENANYQESPSSQNHANAAVSNKPVPAPRRYASNSSLDFDKPYPGQHNPGQADLGMKALSGSVPGLNESMENLGNPGPVYRNVSQDPRV